jgi:uncharacterized protein YcfJ
MKKLALAVGILAISTSALAETARVIDVEPIFGNVVKTETVPVIKSVCYDAGRRNSKGLIEKGINSGFGSQEGLLGTVIGYGIGNEIGGGSGNEIAKVLGAVIGNKVGNTRAATKGHCEMVETVETQRFYAKDIIAYNVDVQLGNEIYTVRRKQEPMLGDYIRIRVSVQ